MPSFFRSEYLSEERLNEALMTNESFSLLTAKCKASQEFAVRYTSS